MENTNSISLDFGALFGRACEASERPEANEPTRNHQDEEKANAGAPQRFSEGDEQAIDLLNIYREQQETKKQIRRVYAEYQDNIRKAGASREEILRGLQAGQAVETLFLQAVEVIGCMTGDADFPRRIREGLLTVYGTGFAEDRARRMQREAVQERLQRLTEAAGREADPDERQRMKNAIKAHQAALDRLEDAGQAAG